MKELYREFRPSIIFLTKFVGLYLVLNLLYGLYIDAYSPSPDPVTILVAEQTSFILDITGIDNFTSVKDDTTGVWIDSPQQSVLSVYEGCNGLNVFIIFVCFLFAYSRPIKKLYWFIPLGFIVIHLFNLFRIYLLFLVTVHFPDHLYFTHKYLFTAIIYSAVFTLWLVWVMKIYSRRE